jgi:hypothetical protein
LAPNLRQAWLPSSAAHATAALTSNAADNDFKPTASPPPSAQLAQPSTVTQPSDASTPTSTNEATLQAQTLQTQFHP